MPRYHWKGSIAFGLVSIPIMLVSTEMKSANIHFHLLDRRDNSRIKNQRVNVNTGKIVPWEQVTRGYEYDKDVNIPVPDEVLKRVGGDMSRVVEIENFIDKKHLNILAVENSYYVVPDKKGDKGYVILREALRDTGKIGIAKVIISTKEYLAALLPHDDAIILLLLKYDNEILKLSDVEHLPDKDLKSYRVTKNEIEIAKKLVASMSKRWQPEKYKDEYQASIHQWVEETVKKIPHKKSKTKTAPVSSRGIDFMTLLKKSLKTNGAKKEKVTKTKKGKKHPLNHVQKQARHATRH